MSLVGSKTYTHTHKSARATTYLVLVIGSQLFVSILQEERKKGLLASFVTFWKHSELFCMLFVFFFWQDTFQPTSLNRTVFFFFKSNFQIELDSIRFGVGERNVFWVCLSRLAQYVRKYKKKKQKGSMTSRWQTTRRATAHALPRAPPPPADFFCRLRRIAYRSWYLLGRLTQPQSPMRGGATATKLSSSDGNCDVVVARVSSQVQRAEKLGLRRP